MTPSPSPSVPASPRLQPSPSQSPYLQDVLVIGSNNSSNNSNGSGVSGSSFTCSASNSNVSNTTQDQEVRRSVTPNRRPSLTQVSTSPSAAGTVLFRPSPTQSPAHIPGLQQQGITTSPAGHEFNTTLVGSNNISLNKVSSYLP